MPLLTNPMGGGGTPLGRVMVGDHYRRALVLRGETFGPCYQRILVMWCHCCFLFGPIRWGHQMNNIGKEAPASTGRREDCRV